MRRDNATHQLPGPKGDITLNPLDVDVTSLQITLFALKCKSLYTAKIKSYFAL